MEVVKAIYAYQAQQVPLYINKARSVLQYKGTAPLLTVRVGLKYFWCDQNVPSPWLFMVDFLALFPNKFLQMWVNEARTCNDASTGRVSHSGPTSILAPSPINPCHTHAHTCMLLAVVSLICNTPYLGHDIKKLFSNSELFCLYHSPFNVNWQQEDILLWRARLSEPKSVLCVQCIVITLSHCSRVSPDYCAVILSCDS